MKLTTKRLDSLSMVRSEFVQWDNNAGSWVVNDNPAGHWQGRTFSELKQHGYITVGAVNPRRPGRSFVELTQRGKDALG